MRAPIPHAVDHLAQLTGFRDRDILDVSLVRALREIFGASQVAIYRVVDDPTARRWTTRARLAAGESTPSADPLWVEPESLPGLDAAPERHDCLLRQVPLAPRDGLRLFPLTTDREPFGVLELETAQPLSAADAQLVQSVLRVYTNVQGLLDDSERDTLTGLLNRKTFDESFLKCLAPPSADGGGRRVTGAGVERFWVGLIDIDHFKRINDGFGHLIGDEVLLLLSRLMRSSFRVHDRLFRFGGEEFVVLMRCADAGAAARAFERLRRNVEAYPFPQVGRITVSIGFTEVVANDSPAASFERADHAIYWAKDHGRNRVCNHAELTARGELHDRLHVGDIELF